MSHTLPFLTTQALRPFTRIWPDMLWRRPVRPGRKVAYLTFDDGPTPTMTRPLLDVLARNDALATCFLIGSNAEEYPGLVRAIADAGHTIGNHSFTHPDAWITEPGLMRNELYLTSELLECITGKTPAYMRPPYGHFTRGMRNWCSANGHEMAMWDVMPGDFLATATVENQIKHIRSTIRPGSVIVLHDNPIVQDVTLPVLRKLLPELRKEGWEFPPL